MKARNVMTVDVTTVAPTTSLRQAQLKMIELGVRHLPVVSRGRLEGIVSDRDLLGASVRKNHRLELRDAPVSQVMARRPFTASKKTTLSQLAQLMVDEKIDAIPITGRNCALVGLVTSSDLLRMFTDFGRSERLPFAFHLRHAED